ncbi:MAG: hypothetical protein ABIG61_03910 [Planctomycetota bacterium]
MIFAKQKDLSLFKWHFFVMTVIILSALVAAIGAAVALLSGKLTFVSGILCILGGAGFIAGLVMAVFAILLLASANVRKIEKNTAGLDKTLELMDKLQSNLTEINHSVGLSESARSIVYRDNDLQRLREIVLDKLHHHDFDGTYELIENIAGKPDYREFADKLRLEANKYRNATEEERINQVIAHIEKLLDQYQWLKAGSQIERLIRAYPSVEKVTALRSMLIEKKQQRKKELLAAWDDAVKRKETNHSLEILKELDLYLTPSEGLALQESASDVFRTKLHNLGVEFSLAVTERRWDTAYNTGLEIIRDFPNSKMAAQIRDKLDMLSQRAEEKE